MVVYVNVKPNEESVVSCDGSLWKTRPEKPRSKIRKEVGGKTVIEEPKLR